MSTGTSLDSYIKSAMEKMIQLDFLSRLKNPTPSVLRNPTPQLCLLWRMRNNLHHHRTL